MTLPWNLFHDVAWHHRQLGEGLAASNAVNFRNASIDDAEMTLWVTSDQFTMVAQCPLPPR